MNKDLYLMFKKSAADSTDCIKQIMDDFRLDYRTVTALIKIINSESDIPEERLKGLLDPEYYTLENVIKMANDRFTDIIPAHFFENDDFLEATGINTIPSGFLSGNPWVESFTISNKIKFIGSRAFSGCKNLKTIEFEGDLLHVGTCAFKDCKNLTIYGLPGSVSYIGSEAFKNCSSITEFHATGKLLQIEEKVFQNCTALKCFYAGKTIRLKEKAFYGCANLIKVSPVVIGLGEECFSGCRSLKEIYVSEHCIPKGAFRGCISLDTIFFESIPEKIKKDAFLDCINISTVAADGFSYQLKEADGFYELIKNFNREKEYKANTGKRRIPSHSCIVFSNSIKKIFAKKGSEQREKENA